jgi:hypothetical protein
MLKKVMPTRDAARHDDDEDICDLDVIVSKNVTFTFQGKIRTILPITTERLFAFWAAGLDFRKAKFDTVEATNKAFLAILKTVCDDINLKEASAMTVTQKAAILEHITRKITGQKSLSDELKKKVTSPEQN